MVVVVVGVFPEGGGRLGSNYGETSKFTTVDDKNMLGNKRPFVPSVGGIRLLCNVYAWCPVSFVKHHRLGN